MYGFNLLSLLFIVDIIYHSINRARQFTKLVYRINSGFLFSTVSIIAIFKLDSTGVCVINIVNIHDDIIYVESILSYCYETTINIEMHIFLLYTVQYIIKKI